MTHGNQAPKIDRRVRYHSPGSAMCFAESTVGGDHLNYILEFDCDCYCYFLRITSTT